MRFSITRLIKFLNCPASYRFQYSDGVDWEFQPVNLVFGKVAHEVLAEYHTRLKTGRGFDCASAFDKQWQDAIHTIPKLRFAKLSAHELLKRGTALLGAYTETINYQRVQDVELYFELPLIDLSTGHYSGHQASGRIDLVADDSIFEFKTSSRSATQANADESVQLTFYAWAYQLLYAKAPKRMVQVNLIKTKSPRIQMLETHREPRDFTRLYGVINQVIDAIEKEVFFPNLETKWGCESCVFQQHCGKQNQTEEVRA